MRQAAFLRDVAAVRHRSFTTVSPPDVGCRAVAPKPPLAFVSAVIFSSCRCLLAFLLPASVLPRLSSLCKGRRGSCGHFCRRFSSQVSSDVLGFLPPAVQDRTHKGASAARWGAPPLPAALARLPGPFRFSVQEVLQHTFDSNVPVVPKRPSPPLNQSVLPAGECQHFCGRLPGWRPLRWSRLNFKSSCSTCTIGSRLSPRPKLHLKRGLERSKPGK